MTADPGTMLDRYTGRTHDLAARIGAGQAPGPGLRRVARGATDLNPLDPAVGQEATARIMEASRQSTPRCFWVHVRRGGGPMAYIMMFSYLPGQGPDQTYSKVSLAPIGEFVPLRPMLRLLSPWVDRIVDLGAGDQPGISQVTARDGRVVDVGLAIWFEVVVDRAVRDLATGGAELLVVPTSNAWFGEGDQSVQHLATSRVRAVEYGRAVAHVSNVGVSGLEGVVHERTALFTQATQIGQLPGRTELTPAARTGPWVLPAGALVVTMDMLRHTWFGRQTPIR